MLRSRFSRRYSRKGEPWKMEELKRLGKTADSRLARQAKRTIQETVAEREARRIALPTAPRRWTAREMKMLGTMSDAELARRLRRSSGNVRYQRRIWNVRAFKTLKIKRWKPFEIRLLGTAPDQEIARRLNRTRMSVYHQRRDLGILYKPSVIRWTKDEDSLLGVLPDAEIARKLKRSLNGV